MMVKIIELFLNGISLFFLVYLILYTTYLFISVLVGALKLYKEEQKILIRNQIKHEYYIPVSILVPAYNEEVTIVDSIQSLLRLDYQLYEIIIINDATKEDINVNNFLNVKLNVSASDVILLMISPDDVFSNATDGKLSTFLYVRNPNFLVSELSTLRSNMLP